MLPALPSPAAVTDTSSRSLSATLLGLAIVSSARVSLSANAWTIQSPEAPEVAVGSGAGSSLAGAWDTSEIPVAVELPG